MSGWAPRVGGVSRVEGQCATFQNHAFVQSPVDLVTVRENTEYLCVKEERTLTELIANRSYQTDLRASEHSHCRPGPRLCAGRNAGIHSNITHKSNVLCQNDGLFRETAKLSSRTISTLSLSRNKLPTPWRTIQARLAAFIFTFGRKPKS